MRAGATIKITSKRSIGGGYRGALAVTTPAVDCTIDGYRHQWPGMAYTCTIGPVRVTVADALEDAARVRQDYIDIGQLPAGNRRGHRFE